MAERPADSELTPGALLRRSRQRYGWSIEDVADELKLLPHVVEAIENDNYADMGGWTYVVGYLRGYAKLVGVNVETAISMHSAMLPQKEDAPGTMTYRAGSRLAIPIPISLVVSVVVVIVVLVGITATYWKRTSDVDRVELSSSTSEPAWQSSRPSTMNGRQAPEPIRTYDSGDELTIGVDPIDDEIQSSSDDVTIERAEAESRSSDQVITVEKAITPKRITEDELIAELNTEVVLRPLSLVDIDTRIIGSIPALEAASDIVTSSEDISEKDLMPALSDSDPGVLILYFKEGSWADVRDSAGQQLLRENVAAGNNVRLEGQPPFLIFLGNAKHVSFRYLGATSVAPTVGDALFGRFNVGAVPTETD